MGLFVTFAPGCLQLLLQGQLYLGGSGQRLGGLVQRSGVFLAGRGMDGGLVIGLPTHHDEFFLQGRQLGVQRLVLGFQALRPPGVFLVPVGLFVAFAQGHFQLLLQDLLHLGGPSHCRGLLLAGCGVAGCLLFSMVACQFQCLAQGDDLVTLCCAFALRDILGEQVNGPQGVLIAWRRLEAEPQAQQARMRRVGPIPGGCRRTSASADEHGVKVPHHLGGQGGQQGLLLSRHVQHQHLGRIRANGQVGLNPVREAGGLDRQRAQGLQAGVQRDQWAGVERAVEDPKVVTIPEQCARVGGQHSRVDLDARDRGGPNGQGRRQVGIALCQHDVGATQALVGVQHGAAAGADVEHPGRAAPEPGFQGVEQGVHDRSGIRASTAPQG